MIQCKYHAVPVWGRNGLIPQDTDTFFTHLILHRNASCHYPAGMIRDKDRRKGRVQCLCRLFAQQQQINGSVLKPLEHLRRFPTADGEIKAGILPATTLHGRNNGIHQGRGFRGNPQDGFAFSCLLIYSTLIILKKRVNPFHNKKAQKKDSKRYENQDSIAHSITLHSNQIRKHF